MEIISSNRRNGKKQELLKKIEEMLYKNEIVFAFNSKQLQERDRQIREKVCKEIAEMCGVRFELIDYGNNTAEFMLSSYDLQQCLDEVVKGENYGDR